MEQKFYFFILLLFLMVGCSSINQSRKSAGLSRQALFKDKDKNGDILPTLFWAHYDATQRGGVYLVNANGTVRIVSENPPDAAITNSIELLAKTKVEGQLDAAAKFSAVGALAELGQRNAGNYMIRDIAFRIESLENNSNGKIDESIISIYKELIKSGEKITIEESKNRIYESKAATLKELTSLIEMSKDTAYMDLKLDSTFIKKIGKFIEAN